MSNHVLIVESDSTSANYMRSALEANGFAVEMTYDAKASIELIRRERPRLVILAVELATGQNGYILCGKLKKDEELKHIPIIIIGASEGFAQHRKLKTRADEYEGKPCNAQALVSKVGGLIGFPEGDATSEDVLMNLTDLVDDDYPTSELLMGASQPPVQGEPPEANPRSRGGDLVDALFDSSADEGTSRDPMTPAADQADAWAHSDREERTDAARQLGHRSADALEWDSAQSSDAEVNAGADAEPFAPLQLSQLIDEGGEELPPLDALEPEEIGFAEAFDDEPRTTIADSASAEVAVGELRLAEAVRERDDARAELALLQAQHREVQEQLETVRHELTARNRMLSDELEGLRMRLASLDESEQRQQKVREALSYALGLLDEAAPSAPDLELIRGASGQR